MHEQAWAFSKTLRIQTDYYEQCVRGIKKGENVLCLRELKKAFHKI